MLVVWLACTIRLAVSITFYTDTNRLLHKNCSNFIERSIWNLSYAPYTITCPLGSLIREANDSLCPEETAYIHNRNKKTEPAVKSLLYRNKIPNFDIEKFWSIKMRPTRIAIAVSGGGFRSMLIGSGVLLAFDDRYPQTVSPLSGLLQSTSYIAGISGGSWLVMSNFINDFEPVHLLKNGVWNFSQLLLHGVPNFDPKDIPQDDDKGPPAKQPQQQPGVFSGLWEFFSGDKKSSEENSSSSFITWISGLFKSTTESIEVTYATMKDYVTFYKELLIEVKDKKKAGFHTSFTDYWGRALARKIFNPMVRSPGTTVTAATRSLTSFIDHDQPFPIIATIEKDPVNPEASTNLDSHCFEITPYEFGSWDSYLNAFVPLKYLGSSLKAGKSTNISLDGTFAYCVSGFDNVGFLTGTSSSLFNHIFMAVYKLLERYQLETVSAIGAILKSLGLSSEWNCLKTPHLHPDYALFSPNPFFEYGTQNANSSISESPDLYMVDGGDDGLNIPFHPFLTAARGIDIILAYDMSNELSNYPNGTVLQRTSQRYMQTNNPKIQIPCFQIPNGITTKRTFKSIFPKVPAPEQIILRDLNRYPLFLGCDIIEDYETLDVTDTALVRHDYLPPLIVYHANTNCGYASNTSTFQLSYNRSEVDGMVANGYNLATSMNSTAFAVCLGCAMLKREFDRISLRTNPQWKDGFVVPKFCKKCYKAFCWRE
ncbi:putative meiotic phospholipase SPO1 [Candida viswanathii]|uniref:Lysophospholipase n=1 Tax=Candida viswanathii TaxID=5486 RepID=A0A367YL37_9ASCO|nr:putative meiotic phospholipase SPO1 [Candida viswanathii]